MKKISFGLILITLVFLPLKSIAVSLTDLENQIQELEKEIKVNQSKVREKEAKAKNISEDIRQLSGNIKETSNRIIQTDLLIKKLDKEIVDKSASIERFKARIDFSRETIAEQLRFINRANHISLFERLITEENLSRVFDSLYGLETVQKRLHDNLETVRASKKSEEEERLELETKEDEQNDYRRLQYNQKKNLESSKSVKNKVLKNTNTEKQAYESLVVGAREEIINIRERIRLLQSDGKQSLSFEEAFDLAKFAESKTDVRAAFIMSILYQESAFNANVGSCHYELALRGSHANTKDIFEEIVKKLGKDPDTTFVSCPIKDSAGSYIGSGGAMGPAQFMPQTWKAYEKETTKVLGYNPNPWDVKDALVAMALLLKENGGLQDERRAAGAYFGSCKFGWVKYCDSVISRANAYQKEIDSLA